MKKPIGMINGVILYEEDLEWTRKLIKEYEEMAEYYEYEAGQREGKSKSGYLGNAARCRKNAERMRQNLAAQEDCRGKWL